MTCRDNGKVGAARRGARSSGSPVRGAKPRSRRRSCKTASRLCPWARSRCRTRTSNSPRPARRTCARSSPSGSATPTATTASSSKKPPPRARSATAPRRRRACRPSRFASSRPTSAPTARALQASSARTSPALAPRAGPAPIGFSGDGITCISDTTCDDEPCGEFKCFDLREGGFECGCGGGFVQGPGGTSCVPCPDGQTSDDGLTCQPDGCFSGPCFDDETCQDTADGFTCGPCPQGFAGDGINCTPGICSFGGVFPACLPCPPTVCAR